MKKPSKPNPPLKPKPPSNTEEVEISISFYDGDKISDNIIASKVDEQYKLYGHNLNMSILNKEWKVRLTSDIYDGNYPQLTLLNMARFPKRDIDIESEKRRYEKKLISYQEKLSKYRELVDQYEKDLLAYNEWKKEEDRKSELALLAKLKKKYKEN